MLGGCLALLAVTLEAQQSEGLAMSDGGLETNREDVRKRVCDLAAVVGSRILTYCTSIWPVLSRRNVALFVYVERMDE